MVQAWWLLHLHRLRPSPAILACLKGVVWLRAPLPPTGHRSNRPRTLSEGNLSACDQEAPTVQVLCRLHVGKLPQPFVGHSEELGNTRALQRVSSSMQFYITCRHRPNSSSNSMSRQRAEPAPHLKVLEPACFSPLHLGEAASHAASSRDPGGLNSLSTGITGYRHPSGTSSLLLTGRPH